MAVSTEIEDIIRVKTLHQWLVSQDIPREQWTPLLMLAVGQDLFRVSQGDPIITLQGQILATRMLVAFSRREILDA